MTPTSIAAYLVLFGSVGFLFLLVSLLLGKLLRPAAPTPSKLDAYECGEPAVGSSFVQFDLRFYVVALVFIVFEVELALFFPPATVFGTATHWMRPQTMPTDSQNLEADQDLEAKLGAPFYPQPRDLPAAEQDARTLALTAAADLAAFFAVILLGFAYVWRRGDLNWVRAMSGSSRPQRNPQLVH